MYTHSSGMFVSPGDKQILQMVFGEVFTSRGCRKRGTDGPLLRDLQGDRLLAVWIVFDLLAGGYPFTLQLWALPSWKIRLITGWMFSQ